MDCWRQIPIIIGILFSVAAYAANPFLNAQSEHQEGEWKTTIDLEGDLCIYEANHPSGHFKKIIWKKGVGLVEYASGYGAHADGYRLKRVAVNKVAVNKKDKVTRTLQEM